MSAPRIIILKENANGVATVEPRVTDLIMPWARGENGAPYPVFHSDPAVNANMALDLLEAIPDPLRRGLRLHGAGKGNDEKLNTVEQLAGVWRVLGDKMRARSIRAAVCYHNLEDATPAANTLSVRASAAIPHDAWIKTFYVTSRWPAREWFGKITQADVQAPPRYSYCPGYAGYNQRAKDIAADLNTKLGTAIDPAYIAAGECLTSAAGMVAAKSGPVIVARAMNMAMRDAADKTAYATYLANHMCLMCSAIASGQAPAPGYVILWNDHRDKTASQEADWMLAELVDYCARRFA